MREKSLVTKVLLAFFVLVQALVPSSASSGEVLGRIKRLFGETHYKGTEPCMGEDGSMECLAENIDWLEHHIDTYGSVVAKQPDIWGEARLTKHRDEYERIMFGELGGFNDTINAAITQSDGAFVAQALALSAAATGYSLPVATSAPPPVAGATPTAVQIGTVTATLPNSAPYTAPNYNKFGFASAQDPADVGIRLEPTLHLDQKSRYLAHLHELRRINEGDDTSDSPGYSMNLVRIPISILPGKLTREGFGAEVTVTAEPVISDDLMPTTFRNLAVNDVVDLLGLPVVRVTESLKEIQDARQGLETKPMAIKNAVDGLTGENPHVQGCDLTDEEYRNKESEYVGKVGWRIRDLLSEPGFVNSLLPLLKHTELRVSKPNTGVGVLAYSELDAAIRTMASSEKSWKRFPVQSLDNSESNPEESFVSRNQQQVLSDLIAAIERPADTEDRTRLKINEIAKHLFRFHTFADSEGVINQLVILANAAVVEAVAKNAEDAKSIFVTVTPSGRARRAINPLNPSSLEPVIGINNFVTIAEFFEKTYEGKYIRWNGGAKSRVKETDPVKCVEHRVDLLDARKFLEAELQAAYDLLSEPEHVKLFASLASPGSKLASQIRSGHFTFNQFQSPGVEQYRHYFFNQLHPQASHAETEVEIEPAVDACYGGADEWLLSQIKLSPIVEAKSSVDALAWAIVVESALLNERLNQDVRKLAKAKEVYELNTDRDYLFFLPDTVTKPGVGLEPLQTEFALANEVFKRYVSARWPIHVFAVDPTSQDQNVADVSQRKRELQFALALGFATGQIGANSLTQYARRLDTQIETISLNRTVVGFGHGADTFGWRFYPRVQALDVPGTVGSLRETFMGASRDYDLKHRQIESGQRECVAVVLMPSFVPYADFDVRTNWFKLTNPKNTALTMKDSLELSRAVTAMRNSRANCAHSQHLYRDGELGRLFKRVDQLDRELPLQTYRSLVPYENTLGGFEMFNTGVTDLAPELIGWYGAPGVRTFGSTCGCYRGCIPDPNTTCANPETCATLTNQLLVMNETLAKSPLPACEGDGTTLFLVGDNFSVHNTKVIAGGTCIPHFRLISRELMQVTIPRCVNTVTLCENGKNQSYVAVYIATPYGVTNHLHVPVMESPNSGGCSPSGVTQNMQPTLAPTLTTVSIRDRGVAEEQFETSLAPVQLSANHRLTTPVRMASMLQDSSNDAQILALASQLNEIEAKLDAVSVPSSTLSGIAVNVSYPESIRTESKPTLFDCKEFPLAHRFQVSCGEQWRNCRDKLPGN